MIEMNKAFKILRQTLLTVLLAALVLVSSLPTLSVQASPATDAVTSAQKASQKEGETYIESAKRAAQTIPKNLGNAEKDTGKRVNRAIDELGNDQLQRAFGADDYKRSEAEEKLAQNKAKR